MKLSATSISFAAATLFLAASLPGHAQSTSSAQPSEAAVPGARASADVPATPKNSETVKTLNRLPSNALLPGNPEVTYVITPRARENEDVPIVRGCWAKLYDEDGLRGDSVTIYGPIGIADAAGAGAGVFDIDWKDRISSIAVGPAAKVSIYDNNNYRDLLLTVKPGQKVDINNALKNFDEIKSLKVECGKKAKRNNAAAVNDAPGAR